MQPEKKQLLIRADAGTEIGSGHLMRCLALGQAWKDAGGKVIYITSCHNEGLLQRLREEDFEIHVTASQYPDASDWTNTKDILDDHPNSWLVLDGYHFDEVYQQHVKESGHRLLVIDDMAHLKHYYADIVLNQNLHAEQLHYSCEPYTSLLLGTRYVLLRREFLAWKDRKRDIAETARCVLVTLGGGDPDNHTIRVIQALQEVDIVDLEAIVISGASNPHTAALEAAIEQSRVPIRLVRDAKNMPELMAWADLAVSSAGTTTWELAFMRVPALLLIQANNQVGVAQELDRVGAAVNLGWAQVVSKLELVEKLEGVLRDAGHLHTMVQRTTALIDGEGVSRVMMQIKGERLRLRQVREEDCGLLWNWANDKDVRGSSFSPESILWDEHIQWFAKKLNDPNCFHFIALDEQDIPIGQVRFDIRGEETEIDVSIDAEWRRCGNGSSLIELATENMFLTTPLKAVHAFVKLHNAASVHAFKKAGFQDSGIAFMRGHQAEHLVRVKGEV